MREWFAIMLTRAPRFVLALVLCFAVLAGSPGHAAAQAGPITLNVIAGYDEHYRTSQWFPVIVEVANDGSDVRGLLEWRFPGLGDSAVYQEEIDLPRGARKRLTMYVVSNSFARSGEVRLLENGNVLETQIVRLTPIDPGQLMVAVVASDPTLLNSLAGMQFDVVGDVNVVHPDVADLPDNAIGMSGLDILFLHDVNTGNLDPAQLEALRLWVLLGGQLVIGGGINAEQTLAGVGDMAPVELGALRPDVSLDSLLRLNPPQGQVGQLPATTVNEVQLRADAQVLDDAGLLAERRHGAGRVVFAAFDLNALRAWQAEALFWSQIVGPLPTFDPAASYRWQNDDVMRNALQLPELSLPSFWVLLLFLGGYVLVIGPVNFLVLRRIGRSDLAWVTTPVLVVVFLLGTYLVGVVLRGTDAQVTQLAVVQSFEGETQHKVTAFNGIFSPNRREYLIGFPARSLVSYGRDRFGSSTADTPIVYTESATEVRDALIDVSALRTFASESTVDGGAAVSSSLSRSARTVEGTVRNTGERVLENVVVVWGDSALQLGTLQPGEERQVTLRNDQRNFPGGIALNNDDEGLFDRERVLLELFDGNMFGFSGPGAVNVWPDGGMPDTQGIYVLAWQATPTVDVQLGGTNSSERGDTLHMIRLDG